MDKTHSTASTKPVNAPGSHLLPHARQAGFTATVVPLVKETSGPRLAYRIAMGVRFADQDWKRSLNRTIAENQPRISKILLSFGVPLLDDSNHTLTEDTIAKYSMDA